MKKIETICIFGDSTAWGAWDTEKGGWVNRLWLEMAEKDDDDWAAIYNCSISGGTTETILKQFESEANVRDADAFIFQTGGNDGSYVHTPESFMVKPDDFRENLQEIIKRARKITDNIIFMGFENCDETKTMPVPWYDGLHYVNKNIEQYNALVREVCKEHNIPFIEPEKLDNDEMEDGLHPNARGHEKIFVAVKDFLTKQGWI